MRTNSRWPSRVAATYRRLTWGGAPGRSDLASVKPLTGWAPLNCPNALATASCKSASELCVAWKASRVSISEALAVSQISPSGEARRVLARGSGPNWQISPLGLALRD